MFWRVRFRETNGTFKTAILDACPHGLDSKNTYSATGSLLIKIFLCDLSESLFVPYLKENGRRKPNI